MKNKILLLSLLIAAPAVVFAAAPAPAPLEAVVDAQQREVAVLQELQAVRADGVQLAARQGFAAVAPYANYAGNIIQWGVTGVGAMALVLWRFGTTMADREITLPAILVGGGVGVGFGIWRSEKKRQNLNRQAAQERARIQHEADSLAALAAAAQRVVTQEIDAAEARRLREEARCDLEVANRRNEELVLKIGELTQSLNRGFADVAQTLGVQQAVNLRALAVIQRTNLASHLASIELNLDGRTEETAAVVRARETLRNLNGALEQLGTLEQRLQVADGQQFALPAPVQTAPADVLTADDTNS